MAPSPKPFDRQTIEHAFERLGELAFAAHKIVEISIYGGSALVLTTDFRVSTGDVDALFDADRGFVREAAALIATEFGWDETWINDGVKGFLSAHDSDAKQLFRTYPAEGGPGLRVFVATPTYLFAMKCLAMRIGGVTQSQDIDDIRQLGTLLGVTTFEEALAHVIRYYPAGRVSPKVQFGLQEIFGGS
ncbi:MAG TPA: hypothetical protein VGG10_06230 [Rhizomicrobium sp.]|jgi:hypothetical protein